MNTVKTVHSDGCGRVFNRYDMVLARAIGARVRCEQNNNIGWRDKWQASIDEILESFPSGSGFDRGTKLDDSSTGEKLVFNTAFHHMNEGGMYDGWTEHQVIVTASLELGCRLKITGLDLNGIKEVIADQFSSVLDEETPEENQTAFNP